MFTQTLPRLFMAAMAFTIASSVALDQASARRGGPERARERSEERTRETTRTMERSDTARTMRFEIRMQRMASELAVIANQQAPQGKCNAACLKTSTALVTIASNQKTSGLDKTTSDEKVIQAAHKMATEQNMALNDAFPKAFQLAGGNQEKAIRCGERVKSLARN